MQCNVFNDCTRRKKFNASQRSSGFYVIQNGVNGLLFLVAPFLTGMFFTAYSNYKVLVFASNSDQSRQKKHWGQVCVIMKCTKKRFKGKITILGSNVTFFLLLGSNVHWGPAKTPVVEICLLVWGLYAYKPHVACRAWNKSGSDSNHWRFEKVDGGQFLCNWRHSLPWKLLCIIGVILIVTIIFNIGNIGNIGNTYYKYRFCVIFDDHIHLSY